MKRAKSLNNLVLVALLMVFLVALAPAVTAQPPELTALERRAEERFAEDDLEGAAELYRELAEHRPDDSGKARALLTVAWIEHLAGRPDATRATLIDALMLEPDLDFRPELYNPPFAELHAAVRQRALNERDRLATAAVRRGAQHLRDNEWSAARAQLEEALSLFGDHPQATYNLALVDLWEDRLEEAATGFSRLRDLAAAEPAAVPSDLLAQALTNLGFVESRRQRHTEAERALAKAVELMPENEPAWTNLGLARRALRRPATEVVEAFRAAHRLAPEDPDVAANLALALLDLEDWEAVRRLLEDSPARTADNPAAWLHLGRARQGQGDSSGAAEAFAAAMRYDPNDAGGWAGAAAVHLANHALESGDADRLRELGERLIAWRPRSANGWVYRGLAQLLVGAPDEARTALEEAQRLEPGQTNVLGHLGNVYLELRLFDLAAEAFQSALRIDPGSSAAREGLATVNAYRQLADGGRAALPGAPPSRPAPSPPPPPAPPPPALPTNAGLVFADVDYGALGLRGVLVEKVEPASPAARAGIEKGDLIFEAGGNEINSEKDFAAVLEAAADRTLEIGLLRANVPSRVELRID